MNDLNFPKGFYLWKETFFEITMWLAHNGNNALSSICKLYERSGRIALRGLADDWTDEFEKHYAGTDWEEKDYFLAIDEFCKAKEAAL
jgi:hypothetical protein